MPPKARRRSSGRARRRPGAGPTRPVTTHHNPDVSYSRHRSTALARLVRRRTECDRTDSGLSHSISVAAAPDERLVRVVSPYWRSTGSTTGSRGDVLIDHDGRFDPRVRCSISVMSHPTVFDAEVVDANRCHVSRRFPPQRGSLLVPFPGQLVDHRFDRLRAKDPQ
jgi:hypothetical protein